MQLVNTYGNLIILSQNVLLLSGPQHTQLFLNRTKKKPPNLLGCLKLWKRVRPQKILQENIQSLKKIVLYLKYSMNKFVRNLSILKKVMKCKYGSLLMEWIFKVLNKLSTKLESIWKHLGLLATLTPKQFPWN